MPFVWDRVSLSGSPEALFSAKNAWKPCVHARPGEAKLIRVNPEGKEPVP
ncbi:MAG: hypothetical protein ACP5QG_03630 [candidate division WOR-3 bacterium]